MACTRHTYHYEELVIKKKIGSLCHHSTRTSTLRGLVWWDSVFNSNCMESQPFERHKKIVINGSAAQRVIQPRTTKTRAKDYHCQWVMEDGSIASQGWSHYNVFHDIPCYNVPTSRINRNWVTVIDNNICYSAGRRSSLLAATQVISRGYAQYKNNSKQHSKHIHQNYSSIS